MTTISKKVREVADKWVEQVYKRQEEIDPILELDWRSIWVGFAVANGLSVRQATSYRLYSKVALPKERQIEKEDS